MTNRIDVLAVMDDLAERYIANRGTTSQFIKCVTPGVHGDDNALRGSAVGAAWLDLLEARAAVAELIEAVEDGIGYGIAFEDAAVRDRIAAALASVQGGAP